MGSNRLVFLRVQNF